MNPKCGNLLKNLPKLTYFQSRYLKKSGRLSNFIKLITMNTPIIKISEDQNEITHESGAVMERVKGKKGCLECVYLNDDGACLAFDLDCQFDIFKLKQNAENE